MKEKQSPVRSIRFSQELYDNVMSFAKENGLNFAGAVSFLLTNALRNTKQTKNEKSTIAKSLDEANFYAFYPNGEKQKLEGILGRSTKDGKWYLYHADGTAKCLTNAEAIELMIKDV